MRLFLLTLVVVGISGCASYVTRKSCESTNWYEYGKGVALEGRRLSGDNFIQQCYKADGDVAESALDRGFKAGMEMYCQPETVFQTGKNGNFFSPEMCTGQGLNLLTQKHFQGVQEYCQKSNGYSAGAKGKAYNKICPASLEAAFLPEFNRGRKRYLATEISENEKQISTLDREISQTQSQLRSRQLELQRYQLIKAVAGQADRSIEFSSEIRQLQYTISAKQNQVDSLRKKNHDLQLEIVGLE